LIGVNLAFLSLKTILVLRITPRGGAIMTSKLKALALDREMTPISATSDAGDCRPAAAQRCRRRWLRMSLFAALLAIASTPSLADPIRVLFERDTNGTAGNELALVSFSTLGDLINNTNSLTQFTQVDVAAAFSVGGLTYDGSAYRVLFERDANGMAGNELALVSFPTLGDLINNTNSLTQFTQVDVAAAFSDGGISSVGGG
jgi:hypothetical protein